MAAWSVSRVLDYYFDEHISTLTHTDTPRVAAFKIAHLKRFFGKRTINSVCFADTALYAAARKKDALAKKRKPPMPATLRGELTLLIAAANFCRDAKKISRDDTPHVKLPPESDPKERYLRRHEAKAAIDYIQNKMKFQDEADRWRLLIFFVIGFYTGARPNVIQKLRWDKVDLEDRQIDFRKSHATGRKHYPRVRIGLELFPYLAQMYSMRSTDWVLVKPRDMRKLFMRLVREMKWKNVTPNTLRHTFLSLAVKDGISFENAGQVAGNTVRTVEKRYAHLAPDHQAHVTDRKQLTGDASLLWS